MNISACSVSSVKVGSPSTSTGREAKGLPSSAWISGEVMNFMKASAPSRLSVSAMADTDNRDRSEEDTSELQSRFELVCRLRPEQNRTQDITQLDCAR